MTKLKDCVSDFSEKYNDFESRQRIAKLLGVKRTALHYWFAKGKLPNGQNYLKLIFLLQACGYVIDEIKDINSTIIRFGELLATSLISIDEAMNLLVLKDRDSVLRILLGRCGTTFDRLDTMADVIRTFQPKIITKKLEWAESVKKPIAESPKINVSKESENKAKKVKYLLLLLADELKYFRDGSKEERDAFRELLTSEDVGYISSLLGMLNDEGAFQRWKSLSTYKFRSFKQKEL